MPKIEPVVTKLRRKPYFRPRMDCELEPTLLKGHIEPAYVRIPAVHVAFVDAVKDMRSCDDIRYVV